ncbi:MAG: ABC transporter permease [Gemmatimonadaceae bacterium]
MTLELALVADLSQVLEAFWRGSLGTSSAFFSGTLVRAIPLAILGVGISIAFRAGVFNIGGEGQLLLGATAGTVVGLHSAGLGPAGLVLALLASVAAGALWAAIAAALRARFGVLEVISTIMLNFVAVNLVSYLVRGPLQEPTRVYPQTDPIPMAARLPRLWPETRLHAGLIIAIAIAAAAWWFLARTAAGFRVRAVGASPTASMVTGRVNVSRVTFAALVASGGLAGLAGGIEVSGVTYALYENLSPGYGFSAIAVAILARLHPLAVLGSALLFATLETGALGMQRDAGVPSVVAAALEAVVILVVVGLSGGVGDTSWRGWRGRAPRVQATA